MKIKRFVAEDMRTALRKVTEILGPDAVILSNNKIEEGIEIVAAIDYDESLIQDPATVALTNSKPIKKKEYTGEQLEIDKRNRQAALDDVRYGRNIPKPQTKILPDEIFIKEKPKASPEPVQHAQSQVQVKNNDHLWTEEPAFMEMKSELKSLKGLLVNQLSELSWGKEVKYHPVRARLLQRLMSLGLSPKIAKDISSKVNEEHDFEHNWRISLGELAHRIPVSDFDIIENGGRVALVGATGVGKTTTIAKLAARYTLKHGPHRVALITTDNFRVAAHEQLRSYARIMGVPMRIAGDADSLREALDDLRDKELILIDTAGMSQRDMLLSKQFTMLHGEGMPTINAYLTLATNCQRGVLAEIGNKFKNMNISGCIFTKVDETTSMGGAMSVAIDNNIPVAYFCDGQQVPEDIHLARKHSIVSRSVSVMQHMASTSQFDEATSMTIGGIVANGHA
ncbi:MAG: flagellar biosynthesis protein FlhF [Woeseiaceae bacterium]